MKTIVAALAFFTIAPVCALAQGAKLQIDHLDRLAQRAEEAVTVDVTPDMLKLFQSFAPANDPKAAAAREVLSGLKGIYVRSFEFGNEKGYTSDDVATIRKQLNAPGWARMVNVDKPKTGEIVDVYFYQEAGKIAGLAVLVAEPDQLTVVNIVGPIDLSKLPALGGQFGIPNLPPVDASGTKK